MEAARRNPATEAGICQEPAGRAAGLAVALPRLTAGAGDVELAAAPSVAIEATPGVPPTGRQKTGRPNRCFAGALRGNASHCFLPLPP